MVRLTSIYEPYIRYLFVKISDLLMTSFRIAVTRNTYVDPFRDGDVPKYVSGSLGPRYGCT